MFLGESFPRGNYVGSKSFKRHLGAISRRILSGGNYLWKFSRSNTPGGNYPGGQYSSQAIILGGNYPGGIILRAIIQGAIVRGKLSGGNFHSGQLLGHPLRVFFKIYRCSYFNRIRNVKELLNFIFLSVHNTMNNNVLCPAIISYNFLF